MKAFIICGLSLLICSCQWLGQGQIPQVDTPRVFPSKSNSQSSQTNLPHHAWWETLKSPELNLIIDEGLACNTDLQIAHHRLEQAQGKLKQIKLSWLPNLELMAGYSTNPALGIPGVFTGVFPQYFINLAQLYKKQERAQFRVAYHQAEINSTRLTLIGQLSQAFFTHAALVEQLQLIKRMQHDITALTQITRHDIAIGLENKINLASYLVLNEELKAQRADTEKEIVLSQNALRFLLNKNPGKISSNQSFNTMDFNQFKAGSLPAQVLDNRPDIHMAALAIKSTYASVSIATTQLFPALTLDQFVGEGSIPFNTAEDATDAYVNWMISPSVLGEIQARKSAYRAQSTRYIQAVRQALREVDDNLAANNKMNALFNAHEQATLSYLDKYNKQKGLVKTGLLSPKAKLLSHVELMRLKVRRNQAHLQQALAVAKLYQALGSGYLA